ncbi:hypothetical protein [uncultured Tateyamaria sp.]|uniref:hypothetical protein n=1 Tax=uncultured Tateyamaria sp. TaxID=455651 RepID=UPI00262E2075|nr:hypothetical protein [uncultured Tateyamaria sp.]
MSPQAQTAAEIANTLFDHYLARDVSAMIAMFQPEGTVEYGPAPSNKLARAARDLIGQNLTFSAIYNIVTVPLALAGYLSPLVAAILMSSSSIAVLANGLRLKIPE